LNAQIRIIPILQISSPIPLKHLAPSHCNIRVSTSSKDSPTPHYNSALLLCLTPIPHLLTNFNLKRDVQSFADALVLLRVWANQRGYGEGQTGWNVAGFAGRGMFWSSIIAVLIKGEEVVKGKRKKLHVVGKGLSSYQLFKAALGFLGLFQPHNGVVLTYLSEANSQT
jgi:U3 small nucleolar RNA-associated protein 22